MRRIILWIVLGMLPAAAVPAAPLHDPFVESFLVGTFDDPQTLRLGPAGPQGLLEPASVDSLWQALAARAMADGDGVYGSLIAVWPADDARAAVTTGLVTALAGLAEGTCPPDAGPDSPLAGDLLTLRFHAALAAGDSATALATASLLASGDVPWLHEGERTVWHLRAAVLRGDAAWLGADALLPTLGPFDAGNAWTLAVALRRAAGLGPFGGPDAPAVALKVGGVAKPWLDAADLQSAPLDDALKSGLGAVALPRGDLEEHFRRHPQPPAGTALQGWWLRGQRRLRPGDAAHYEALAARPDIAPVWQMDLWRRASERRILSGAWTAGRDDLDRALLLAAQPSVPAGPSSLVRDWAEQAYALALARARRTDAEAVLQLARSQAAVVRDERFRATVRLMATWLEGGEPGVDAADRIEVLRLRVRQGQADEARLADERDAARLRAAAAAPAWDLWRRWGLALTDTSALAVAGERAAAAAAYHASLLAASDAPSCLAAAVGRLVHRPEALQALAVFALDRDVQRQGDGGTSPLPSPVPGLAAGLAGSQGDLHALLGVALHLGDMRGTLGVASLLPGSGLTRDEKRRFLYPLPAPGPILDALLASGVEPALLLAIARNESLFEPAVRSRAGALGWMQIMPFHYPERGALPGADHWGNPRASIGRGAALVTENRRRYGGDPYRLLAAYNAGPQAVARWDEQLGEGADRRLFLAWIGYTETRDYVEKVLVDRAYYADLLGGADAPAQAAKE